MNSGVFCYFGVTTSGKTTLALEHLKADVARDGRPSLIIDCMPARNLRQFPHEPSVEAVLRKLYGEGVHAVYSPRSADELGELLAGVHAAGTHPTDPKSIHVLWDEAAIHTSPQSIPDAADQAVRGWQHNDCVFRVVSQRPGDLNGVFYAAIPECYVFRLEREVDLDRVRKELSLDPAAVKVQDQGQFLTYSRDRFKKVNG